MTLSREVQERWSRMLQDADPRVQMKALTEIGRSYFHVESRGEGPLKEVLLGEPAAVQVKGPAKPELPTSLRDAILSKLEADDPSMRAEAVLALVHWQDEETIDAVLERLKDSDSTVRLAAVQALAMLGEAELIPDLLEVARSDPEELVRAHALSALAQIPVEETRGWEGKASGAVRTRGGVTLPGYATVLKQIAERDSSRYVAFLAQKALERF
jgi:hypothetical protein